LRKIEKRSEVILEKFMEEAKKVIFEPPIRVNEDSWPKTQKQAHCNVCTHTDATRLALEIQKKILQSLNCIYLETRQIAYSLGSYHISGSLERVYDDYLPAKTLGSREQITSILFDSDTTWPQ
jgi:hypothetical protein